MSTYSDVQAYGLSREQAWAMLPLWARRELERRHDGRIPIASMIDAMSWPAPPLRSEIEEELHWIALYAASARCSACHHLRLIRAERAHREVNLRRLHRLRTEHSRLMARRGDLLRAGRAAPLAVHRDAA